MVPRYVTRVAVPSPSGQQLTCITGKYDIHVSCRHQCTATEPRATRISVLIPHHARMRMVFGSITKNVDNPDAWVQACLRIYDCCQRTPLLPELSRASASSCASSLPDPDLGSSTCGGFPQGAPGLVAGALGSHGRDRKFRHHGTYHFCSWANVPSYPRPRPLAVFMIFSIMGVFEEEVMATHISCLGVAQEPWSRRRSMRINVAQPHPELGVQVLRVWWLSRPPAEAAKNRQSQSRGRLCRDAQSFSAAPRNGCGQSPCHHARVQCPTGRTPASTSSRCSTLTR